MDRQAIFKGDWRTLRPRCSGTVEVWDQTIGCPECQMNMWYTPGGEHESHMAEQLPVWAPTWVYERSLDIDRQVLRYDDEHLYALFNQVHPFQFDDCHDDGDEDDGDRNPWRVPLLEAMKSDH